MATTPMTPEEHQRRAIERALARGGAATVQPGVYTGTYRVRSATRGDEGVHHDVAVDGATWRCTCEAALAGRPACWHRAAVAIYRIEASGARVVGAGTPRAA